MGGKGRQMFLKIYTQFRFSNAQCRGKGWTHGQIFQVV